MPCDRKGESPLPACVPLAGITSPSFGLPGCPTFSSVAETSPRISVLHGFPHCTLIHIVNPEIVGSPCLVMEIVKENMAQDPTQPSPTPFTRIYRHLSLEIPSDFGRRRFNQGRGWIRHHNSPWVQSVRSRASWPPLLWTRPHSFKVMAVGSNDILRWHTQNVGLPIIENL